MLYDYLQLEYENKKPLYQQLYEQIRRAVQEGHLSRDEKMPSIRGLAEGLGLSRTTIEAAYQQLCVEGYLKSKPQSGYFVAASGKSPVQLREIPGDHYKRIQKSLVKYNLGTDVVDLQNADMLRWKRCVKDVLNRKEVLVSYGEKQGELELREALSRYSYSVRGVISTADSIVIGAGTQPLLSILCGLLPRDSVVAIEEPGFRQAEQVFQDYGFPVRRVGSDQDGVSLKELKSSKAGVLFVSPSNRMRARGAIPMNRRFELLNWVQEGSRLIIEDDYNGELRYSAKPIPALQSLDGGERVVYLNTFAKSLAPSLRISYMVLPPHLLERWRRDFWFYSSTVPSFEQYALARFMERGHFERHLNRTRTRYKARREALLAAARDTGLTRVGSFAGGDAGLHLLLWMDGRWSEAELVARAVDAGVGVAPLSACDLTPPPPGRHGPGPPAAESRLGILSRAALKRLPPGMLYVSTTPACEIRHTFHLNRLSCTPRGRGTGAWAVS